MSKDTWKWLVAAALSISAAFGWSCRDNRSNVVVGDVDEQQDRRVRPTTSDGTRDEGGRGGSGTDRGTPEQSAPGEMR